MGSIFLSYAGADRDEATQLKAGLQSEGIDVWFAGEVDFCVIGIPGLT